MRMIISRALGREVDVAVPDENNTVIYRGGELVVLLPPNMKIIKIVHGSRKVKVFVSTDKPYYSIPPIHFLRVDERFKEAVKHARERRYDVVVAEATG